MLELIDLIFNQYLRLFVGVVLVGLVCFSLYYNYKDKLKKLLGFNNHQDKWKTFIILIFVNLTYLLKAIERLFKRRLKF